MPPKRPRELQSRWSQVKSEQSSPSPSITKCKRVVKKSLRASKFGFMFAGGGCMQVLRRTESDSRGALRL